MNFDIRHFIKEFAYGDEKAAFLTDFQIVDVLYRRSLDFAYIKAENAKVLPYGIYMDLISYFKKHGLNNLKLYIKAKDQDLPIKEINLYLESYAHDHDTFRSCVPLIDDDGFVLSYTDQEEHDHDQNDLDELKLYFYDLGYRKQINMRYKPIEENIIVETREAKKPKPKPVEKPEPQQTYRSKKKEYTELKIEDLEDGLNDVKFRGKIFKVDERKTRTGMTILTLYVKDESDAVVVKVVEGKRFTAAMMKDFTEGQCAYFSGGYHFDPYSHDLLFEPNQIELIDDFDVLIDDAPKKRLELHAHTKLSEMDGVSSPEELVKAAYAMGHRAVAITDHLCLQGFHEAYANGYKAIKKKDPDADFKVLYGCEMNMVSPYLNIVYNANEQTLKDAEYIVFDLETTGLSTRYDYIIEFGAVLMRRGTVIEEKDFFVKPPIAMSEATKRLTHISESDLASARTFAECKDEILDFIKDRILVAHNASFDFGFLNSELERVGEKPLTNPVIDTLDLSRSLLKNRRYHSLGSLCRAYNIAYDENVAHRADYDATVLANSFNFMLKDLNDHQVYTLKELSAFQDGDAFVRNRAFHTIVLCRDQEGLKDLFKLVSISNTDTLAIFGKANTKDQNSEFIAEPRIFKETIEKYRKHLLIGSACLNGEIFEIASTRSKEELAKAISFYDYIEVQPLENYRFLYETREQFSKERLMVYLKDIIDEALKQNKPIVATGDVHYVRKEEKILRDVYINAIPLHGGHHPLYIFDKEKRKNTSTPDQRLLNTKEMLKAFAWLKDEKLIEDLVINNPNKVADMCENVKPFSDDLRPPKIDDAIAVARRCHIDEEPFCGRNEVISADEYLKQYVYYNAHQVYGDVLDETIEKRLETELNNIIGHGYGVIYFVCHLLIKRSNDDGYLVGSRGSVGSSLVATMSNITEVNPLAPHYICPHCHKLIWMKDVASGYDLPDKTCPDCGSLMNGDGQNIPFETFLGFDGDKIPDIDLNFSGDYQPKAHLFTREIFGPENVFRAGTISTVAEKTAFGYVTGYCEEKEIGNMSRAQRQRLASGCEGVKRTTGQHAGGIVVLPDDMEIEDVTPIQYPANDPQAAWRSTHFEYHDYSDNLLKFDLLGHVDPTAMRLFENISGIDVKTIPMNDEKVLSLFYSPKALNIINPNYHEETGAAGLPEFGTLNTRGTIEETRPHLFSELVQISGLSHGTDVWRGNAQELIRSGIQLSDVIGCRDDIMTTLMGYDLEPLDAFTIMEKVRKGKGLTESEEGLLKGKNVPQWYIDSCKKIKYMFPKAHAVAYCIMAVRVAWFKVYHPEYYYVSFFTLRCDAYEIETMVKDADMIYARMQELLGKINNKEATKKEKDIFDTLEVCYEMVSRGYKMTNIDLNRSLATEFRVDPENQRQIIPPFKILDGLGDNVAESIVSAREEREFLSKEDLLDRTLLSQTLIKKLDALGVLKTLDETNQMTLF